MLLQNIKSFLYRCLVQIFRLSTFDTFYLKMLYRYKMGSHINLKNPKTFTEKINWLKLNDRKSIYTTMVDKIAVKEYVAKIIGEKYIIPTLGIWNTPFEIEWDKLPSKFVLKTTHGGGSSGVVICKNKESFDINHAITLLSKSMNIDIYKYYREWPYKNVPKRIIAEEYMEQRSLSDSDGLTDYKFYCFNGQPLYCQVIRNRHTKERIDFYDVNWIHQSFVGLNPSASIGGDNVERPKNLTEMLSICRLLSNDTKFLRVDLYIINDAIYFGELTFYPASGLGFFSPAEWNLKLGDLIQL